VENLGVYEESPEIFLRHSMSFASASRRETSFVGSFGSANIFRSFHMVLCSIEKTDAGDQTSERMRGGSKGGFLASDGKKTAKWKSCSSEWKRVRAEFSLGIITNRQLYPAWQFVSASEEA
tara:strand:- start:148 stop:510 length:363 start_codon:yes stop_codon:yes gene_type:complete